MKSRFRFSWIGLGLLLAVSLVVPAHAAVSFTPIPGKPIGLACAGDGPGGVMTDTLFVTSYNLGNLYSVSDTAVVTLGATSILDLALGAAAPAPTPTPAPAPAPSPTPAPTAVPSVSQWALIGMAGLFAVAVLMGMGMQARRRRKAGFPR